MSAVSPFRSGALVTARGREWVVLPESAGDLLMLHPAGGLNEEVTGVLTSIEPVESATFRLPGREDLGDFTSGRLLRDAARLSTRAAAGPFRSFGRIAVEPRPYQLVPLMMALKLDPVRMLIADDVGIGKTIEACLIARELLDRGEIRRLTVLCPPHLAEQWQRELGEKFHIEAELVLSSTIQRLERDLPLGVSVFDRHPFTVVSTDFILAFAREYVSEDGGGERRRRVRYWSALALLRCVSSSPAAAAATLRSRAAVDETAEGEDVDEVGRRTVLDQGDDDDTVALDFSPGSETEGSGEPTRRRLLAFARRAETLDAADDRKLQGAVREIKALLTDGFHPVVFCRFVDTAEYAARHLRAALAKGVRGARGVRDVRVPCATSSAAACTAWT